MAQQSLLQAVGAEAGTAPSAFPGLRAVLDKAAHSLKAVEVVLQQRAATLLVEQVALEVPALRA
jgi:hypothetical protein